MINYEKETIELDGQSSKIKDYRVFWLGPTGLVTNLTMAKQIHASLGGDDTPFFMAWKAVPVAVAENGQYEEIR